MADNADLPAEAFARQDEGDDLAFYALPRLVTHIDEGAVAALTARYRELLPEQGRVLDLMSSWVSHLPDDRTYAEVVGHGMNERELAANPRLDRRFVQDLNRDPFLPFAPAAFDAALCCVGVQYLQRPVDVFAEVRRTLGEGAPFIVSFSNRCFPTKAVAIWRALDPAGHAPLIASYLARAGFRRSSTEILADGRRGDPLTLVIGYA
ncbi:methyltransferase domain-containing protein [Sphingomonas yunnanensis]|uniref:methyltransferase domain-containing protein n=1 Tax=Sphingomonas yunnanensis TaxID=310400 RepID=UPI001CA68078|nr:methyltransferase domain-containing protein [Sphingomonas yunnanensis]MBY9063618.1 methyltransferase domain-containing protein [Sphingomonas yunnanensis]